MLLKVSCVAILIAMACLHISCASVKTEAETTEMKKVAETETETETAKLTEEDTTGERQKRALYYQNDLVSNQERQLRKAFPLGVNPIYDYPIYGGVLPVYDYLYYDYLVDPLYPVYPIYPIYDYYDYLYPDYLFPLSAKSPARGASPATTKQLRGGARRAQAVSTVGAPKAGTRNLSGRRVQHGAQPLSRVHQHPVGHPQAAAFMNPQHLKQHQSFGEHIPHAFGQAGAPGAAPFAPPPSAAPSYLQQQQKFSPQAQAYNQQQQQQQQDRLKNQFNAIKLASSKGSARNQE